LNPKVVPRYVPVFVSPNASSETMTIVGGMMNERSGLWLITDERVGLLRANLHVLSNKSRPAIQEMISIANGGGRFWPTKAEYYAAVNEIRSQSSAVSKEQIESAISGIIRGSKTDGMAHREWVKQAMDVLNRISKGMKT
jgi:phage I-like protein